MQNRKDHQVSAHEWIKEVEAILSGVPESRQYIAVEGAVQTPDGQVIVTLKADPAGGSALETARLSVEKGIKQVAGHERVSVILTAERTASKAPDPHGMAKNPKLDLPIKKIIAVASGKGGVGKSTIAAHLAVALARKGLKTGLLDADIYGPSQPRMMGLQGHKPEQRDEKIIPLEAHGVKVMSIGFMVEEHKALVWRGPMVQSALYQLLRDVNWGSAAEPLDVLLVDMPPGTGDAQLTMAQKVPLSGAIIVSTPQDIALLDARRGVEMFHTVGVPILGVVENMSMHVCSNCGHAEPIFGTGGAKAEAEAMGVPFLGAVPLDISIRQAADAGETVFADVFDAMVEGLKAEL